MSGPGTGNHITQKGKRIPEWQRIRITAIQTKEDPPSLHMKQDSKIEERSLEFTHTDDFTVLTREWLVKTIAVELSN